jgi:hypothetical protein
MKPLRLILVCVAVAVFGAMALAKLPHVLYGKRIAGQVVDADTGQAIAGAHVAFIWVSGIIPSGFTGHNSRDICYHAAAAVTDEAGRFRIEPWRKWSTYNVYPMEPVALVYVRNYAPRQILLHEGFAEPPMDRPNERFALKAFKGTVDERLDAMWGGVANRGCMYGGESQKSLYPMLKAIYDEARSSAKSPDQMRRLQQFAWIAARVALAYDPNSPSHDAQVDEFIRGNLR